MATEIDIANLALGLVSERSIVSLEDDSKQARVCKKFIDQVYEEELRTHTWACAQKRESLALNSTTPAFRWGYSHKLPSDFIRVTEYYIDFGGRPRDNFEREGDNLLSNDAVANIVYVYKAPYGTLDPLAVKVVYYALAIAICFPLMNDDSLKQRLVSEYNGLVAPTARYVDSTEREVDPEEDSSWINARVSSTNG